MDASAQSVTFFVISFAIFAFSCIFHECAHVWVALKQGDPTGKDLGRLTFHPAPHFDLFWSLLLPLFTLWSWGFPVGGPKPAPVNPSNFANPRVGDLWCSLAGPASNLLLAAAGLGVLWGLQRIVPSLAPADSWNAVFLFSLFRINVSLAIINLIPVPPLDGSRFLHFVVGRPFDPVMNLVDRAGWLTAIPIFFAFFFLAPYALRPFWQGVQPFLDAILGVEYLDTLVDTFRVLR